MKRHYFKLRRNTTLDCEKRSCERLPIKLDIEVRILQTDNNEAKCYRTDNIGLGGALLLTGNDVLPQFRLLELKFKSRFDAQKKLMPIVAHVVRQTSQDTAIRFRKIEPTMLNTLLEVIYNSRPI